MIVSIIIPTYNEENTIGDLLNYLKKNSDSSTTEYIVVDGGSDDDTVKIARNAGGNCLKTVEKGRAAQMNLGAEHATGDILYFVHADSIPPATFVEDIKSAVKQGNKAGCYRFKFDSARLLLKINAFFTRFDRLMCRGGDQTLFITGALFKKLNGFREDYLIMEDYEMIERIQESSSFKIIPKDVVVSPRKYKKNGYLKVQLANFVVFMMYFLDCTQEQLLKTYRKMLYETKF